MSILVITIDIVDHRRIIVLALLRRQPPPPLLHRHRIINFHRHRLHHRYAMAVVPGISRRSQPPTH
jgi:hypothetical protein